LLIIRLKDASTWYFPDEKAQTKKSIQNILKIKTRVEPELMKKGVNKDYLG
jgi:hypothetical protein